MIASRMASEIWSHILSGWPSVTDSEVNRYWAASTMLMGAKPSTGSPDADPSGRPQAPARSASRSRSRSIRCSTSSPMIPSSRSAMTASRSASRTALRISRCSSSSCSASSRGPSGVRPDVAGLVLVARAQLVDELHVARVLDLEVVEPLAAPPRRPPAGHGPPRCPGRRSPRPRAGGRASGSVRPWPTSVATITQKVRKMTRSRSGNGRARAAGRGPRPARPRRACPPTRRRTRPRGGGYGSRARILALSSAAGRSPGRPTRSGRR